MVRTKENVTKYVGTLDDLELKVYECGESIDIFLTEDYFESGPMRQRQLPWIATVIQRYITSIEGE